MWLEVSKVSLLLLLWLQWSFSGVALLETRLVYVKKVVFCEEIQSVLCLETALFDDVGKEGKQGD